MVRWTVVAIIMVGRMIVVCRMAVVAIIDSFVSIFMVVGMGREWAVKVIIVIIVEELIG